MHMHIIIAMQIYNYTDCKRFILNYDFKHALIQRDKFRPSLGYYKSEGIVFWFWYLDEHEDHNNNNDDVVVVETVVLAMNNDDYNAIINNSTMLSHNWK